jgi:hypothetical protein
MDSRIVDVYGIFLAYARDARMERDDKKLAVT